MDDYACLLYHQEKMEELKDSLLHTTFELESLKMEASNEIMRLKESVKHLFQSVEMACRERDEAKDQLQRLLNFSSAEIPNSFSHHLVKPRNVNSSFTESSSLSVDTYNYRSHSSSPGHSSFFDPLSSPEHSNVNMGDSRNNAFVNPQPSALIPKTDEASLAIECLIVGKALPEKGKLLQAIQEAGPLLETFLVAGPLPRWRNPPTLRQIHIPPVSIRECASEIVTQKQAAANLSPAVVGSPNPQSYLDMPSQLFDFENGRCGTGQAANGRLIPGANVNEDYMETGKRQRLQ